MKYLVLVEQGPSSWGAHVPDLPGCVTVGESREETIGLVKEAIAMHLDDLRDRGEAIPTPTIESMLVDTDAA